MDDRVALRPVRENDLPVLERLTNEPKTPGPFQWFGWHDPGLMRRRWMENGLLDSESSQMMIIRGADRLGFVSWFKLRTNQTSFCWNVGLILIPEARGRGYGTQAQRLLTHYLFSHTQVNRIEAETEVDNIAEQRALEKAGFTREGIRRGYGFRAGRWRDNIGYSVLRDEVELDETGSGV